MEKVEVPSTGFARDPCSLVATDGYRKVGGLLPVKGGTGHLVSGYASLKTEGFNGGSSQRTALFERLDVLAVSTFVVAAIGMVVT